MAQYCTSVRTRLLNFGDLMKELYGLCPRNGLSRPEDPISYALPIAESCRSFQVTACGLFESPRSIAISPRDFVRFALPGNQHWGIDHLQPMSEHHLISFNTRISLSALTLCYCPRRLHILEGLYVTLLGWLPLATRA